MKDMTCSFAAAWVRETRAARNAEQPTTPWAFRARGIRRGKRVDSAVRLLVHIRGQKEVFSSGPQLKRAGAWLTMAERCKAGIDCDAAAWACAACTDRLGVRPVDTLPGGLNSLKSKRTSRVEKHPAQSAVVGGIRRSAFRASSGAPCSRIGGRPRHKSVSESLGVQVTWLVKRQITGGTPSAFSSFTARRDDSLMVPTTANSASTPASLASSVTQPPASSRVRRWASSAGLHRDRSSIYR